MIYTIKSLSKDYWHFRMLPSINITKNNGPVTINLAFLFWGIGVQIK